MEELTELRELLNLLYYVAFYYGNPGEAEALDGVKKIPAKGGFQEGLEVRNQRAFREIGWIKADLAEYVAWRKSRVARLVNDN